jgi:hypothetical protein
MSLTDIILIVVATLVGLLIVSTLALYTYGKYNINLVKVLNILILLGLLYLVFLQNNQINKMENNPQNSQLVEDMNKYLTILSPLIPMVDKDGNPITYPST